MNHFVSSLASDLLTALDGKCFVLPCFLMYVLTLRFKLTLACVVVALFPDIMGDFSRRQLIK